MSETTGHVPERISRLHADGFRVLSDFTLELRSRFVLLVGANGSGKTSALDALFAIARQTTKRAPGEPALRERKLLDESRRRSPRESAAAAADAGTDRMVLAIDKGTTRFTLDYTNAGPTFRLHQKGVPFEAGPDETVKREQLLAASHQQDFPTPRRLRLSARELCRASLTEDTVPHVDDAGAGLPSFLAWIAGNAPDVREAIEGDLRQVIPSFRRFRIPNVSIVRWHEETLRIDETVIPRRVKQELWGQGLELEYSETGYVPAHLASEGTLIALALLAVVHGERPRLLLLDDLDKALHPTAQATLAAAIHKALEAKPEIQVVATTHSPYLVDSFSAESIALLALDERSRSTARLLSDHPRYERLRQGARTGELWSSVGESWVLDAPKAP